MVGGSECGFEYIIEYLLLRNRVAELGKGNAAVEGIECFHDCWGFRLLN